MVIFWRPKKWAIPHTKTHFLPKRAKNSMFFAFFSFCAKRLRFSTTCGPKKPKNSVFLAILGLGLAWRAKRSPFFGTPAEKLTKNIEFLAMGSQKSRKTRRFGHFLGPIRGQKWQKCRLFDFFCKKWKTVGVSGPFLPKSGVWLGRGCVFVILYVICGVFARF